jgi:hypothetical protein
MIKAACVVHASQPVLVVVMGMSTWSLECTSRFCCGRHNSNKTATLPGPSVLRATLLDSAVPRVSELPAPARDTV